MRRIIVFLIAGMLLFPGFAKSVKAAPDPGVTIGGYCWTVGGTIASQASMILMQQALAMSIQTAATQIVEAINKNALGVQGATTQSANAELQAQARAAANKMRVEEQAAGAKRMIFEMPVDICNDIGYYVQRSTENIQGANAILAADERTTGLGERGADIYEKAKKQGQAAEDILKHGFIFASTTYTPEQSDAFTKIYQLLFNQMKNPKPKNVDWGSIEGMRYYVAEARASESRVLLTEPFRQFGLDRQAQIPAKEIYNWVGNSVNKPVTVTFTTDENGKANIETPVTTPIKENGKISRRALFELIADRYMSSDFLKQAQARNASGILKEMLPLLGYEFGVMLDIRNTLMYGNILLAMGLNDYYDKLVNEADRILVPDGGNGSLLEQAAGILKK